MFRSLEPIRSYKFGGRMKFSSGTKSFLLAVTLSQFAALGCRVRESDSESQRGPGKLKKGTNHSTFMGDGTIAGQSEGGKQTTTPVQTSVAPPACNLLDPNGNITQVIPGGPAQLAIPISKYVKQPGLVQFTSAQEAKFKFDVFDGPKGLVLEWPSGVGGHHLLVYEATISSADTEKCLISAVLVDRVDNRTMLGCFDPSTKIRMADGQDLEISGIQPGDMVFNPVTAKAVPVARVSKGPEAGKGLYLIGFAGKNRVKVTAKHPFMTNFGLRTADQLTKGDQILTPDGSFRKIEVAKVLPEKPGQVVINVALAGAHLGSNDHMVLANGVVSGDLQLQERLENMSHLSLVDSRFVRKALKQETK
jgi:hypothetical protein